MICWINRIYEFKVILVYFCLFTLTNKFVCFRGLLLWGFKYIVLLIIINYFNYDKMFVFFNSLGLMVYFNGFYSVSKDMSMRNFFTLVDKSEYFNSFKNWLKEKEDELEWFCGFSEAESLFYVSTKGALTFRIKLHWDDRRTLVYIQNLLSELADHVVGVIIDSKDQHESYYSIDKYEDLQEIIIPIFSQ